MLEARGASAAASSSSSSHSRSSSSLLSSLSFFALGASLGAVAAICHRRATVDRWRDDGEPGAIKDGVLGLVGGTPLVRIRCLSEATGCEILAKAEFCNPGGSVKDRVAAAILTEASSRSSSRSSSSVSASTSSSSTKATEAKTKELPLLRPGGLVTEGTAGSTGVSLAMLAPSFGVRAAVWMPDDAAEEKSATMEALGARVTRVRPCSIASPEHFVNLARAAAEREAASSSAVAAAEQEGAGKRRQGNDDDENTDDDSENDADASDDDDDNRSFGGGLFADQFENPANARCHELGTGEEIWRQTKGEVDAFVCGAGTGGTLAGVAAALKKKKTKAKNGGKTTSSLLSRLFSRTPPPSSSPIAVVLVDPHGSSLFNAVTRGVAYSRTEAEGKRKAHQVDTVVEGVGLNRITRNFARALPLVDGAVECSDAEAVEMARHLLRHDGLFVGSSAAVNCVGAVKVARALLAKEEKEVEEEEKKENENKESENSSSSSSKSVGTPPPPPTTTTPTTTLLSSVLSSLSSSLLPLSLSPSLPKESIKKRRRRRPVVVTLLCDGGGRHLSKFHSGDALREAGLAAAVGPVRSRRDLRFVL